MSFLDIYILIGILNGSFSIIKSLKSREFRANSYKLKALTCVFFWPIYLWKERCFFNEPDNIKKPKTTKRTEDMEIKNEDK